MPPKKGKLDDAIVDKVLETSSTASETNCRISAVSVYSGGVQQKVSTNNSV